MDDEESAWKYRDMLVSQRYRQIPTIYTPQVRLNSNGIRDPQSDMPPHKLKYTLGALSKTNSKEYEEINHDLEVVPQILECLRKRDERKQELIGLSTDESEIEELKQRVKVCTTMCTCTDWLAQN